MDYNNENMEFYDGASGPEYRKHVDRSYHPFKVIREYQDRGMMKWQGFYLSEHTTAMREWNQDEKLSLNGQSEMDKEEKYLLLQQSYLNHIEIRLKMKPKKHQKVEDKTGRVTELLSSEEVLLVDLKGDYERVEISEVWSVEGNMKE